MTDTTQAVRCIRCAREAPTADLAAMADWYVAEDGRFVCPACNEELNAIEARSRARHADDPVAVQKGS
jgi:hypothetical protein